ncbi:MAG: hypothetical protein ACLU99_08595 [Alphaproteobacteria bacterium]
MDTSEITMNRTTAGWKNAIAAKRDKCGCTFPNNISNYGCDCTQNLNRDKFNEEKSFDQAQNPDYKKAAG